MTITSPTLTDVCLSTVLGKRKSSQITKGPYVLHLASSPEPSHHELSDSEFDLSQEDFVTTNKPTLISRPVIVNGRLVENAKKRYQCTYAGCQKAYSKPSRLEEHERSHTGERPYVCSTCNKSYLRETHLQAHARSHLPESARPLMCPELNCGKRFWTSQHLRTHTDWHNGAKSFICPEADCDEAFSKHYQLRTHVCTAHAPPGTKPFQCEHTGCPKSFSTTQHLRAHMKVHDDKRYTCVMPACLPAPGQSTVYYSTWTKLQHHIRIAHPPTCAHPSCGGRTFTSQKSLRAHQKLHEEKDMETGLDAVAAADSNEHDGPMKDGPARKKQRRGGEFGRDWKCEVVGCGKDFKSKKALTMHTNVTHLGRRDHVCSHQRCQRAFGYKHLLQRHLAKVHAKSSSASSHSEASDEDSSETSDKEDAHSHIDIDVLTGQAYAVRAKDKVASSKALRCTFPDMTGQAVTHTTDAASGTKTGQATKRTCDYVFTRAYDFRRHLRAIHNFSAEKEALDMWVKEKKARLTI